MSPTSNKKVAEIIYEVLMFCNFPFFELREKKHNKTYQDNP